MVDLKLSQNEAVIIQNASVLHNDNTLDTGELYLTNLNIIYAQKGLFGKVKNIIKFPLTEIKEISGELQAIAAKSTVTGKIQLQLYLQNGQEYFSFVQHSKKETEKWIKEINRIFKENKKLEKKKQSTTEDIVLVEAEEQCSSLLTVNSESKTALSNEFIQPIFDDETAAKNAKKRKLRKCLIAFFVIFFLITVSSSDSNNAEKFDWSNDIVLSDILPEPKSNKGIIYSNDESELDIDIYNTSKSKYDSFVDKCKNHGFIIESELLTNSYHAYNSDGYELSLNYSESSEKFDINVSAPIKMNEICWKDGILTKLLPEPISSIGKIKQDNENDFIAYIGETPKDIYESYVVACSKIGFTLNKEETEDSYCAQNNEGYPLKLEYIGNDVMLISLSEALFNIDLEIENTEDDSTVYNEISVYIDDKHQADLEYGENKNLSLQLTKGTHTLKVESVDDSDIHKTLKINVIEAATYNYAVKVYYDKITVEDLNTVFEITTETTTEEITAEETSVKETEEETEDADKVTTTETTTEEVTTEDITTEESTTEETTTEKQKSGITVYTTPTGEKYHRSKSCAGKNAIEHDLDDVKDWYDPCKKCAW